MLCEELCRRINNHNLGVLILVVMEDALRDKQMAQNTMKNIFVLILVVMEDALREVKVEPKKEKKMGLNPCCNGRCSARSRLFL